MFQDICKTYSNSESRKLGIDQLFDLKNQLKDVDHKEIDSISDAKSFISLLRKLREAIAESDKLHGENYPELLSSLLSVGENGLYSDNLRFFFELIQNVDDCDFENPEDCRLDIHFDFNNGQIILTYNEVGFTPFNVFAITGIAEAAKNISAEKNEIGEKGIGFKSVFGIADRVWIKSGWFSFALHKKDFTIPIEMYDSFDYQRGTQMVLYVGDKTKDIYDLIKSQYCKKDAIFSRNPILFLNNLTSLRMYYDAWRSMEFNVSRHQIERRDKITREDNVVISVELHDHDQTSDLNIEKEEIVCTRYSYSVLYSEKACRSRYGKDTKVGSNGGKRMLIQAIIPQTQFIKEVGTGALYSFLPTQMKLSVPVICHVPFKLDASRESIDSQGNNEWYKKSVDYLSQLMDHVFLDWCKTVKQEIISYLPAWNNNLFAKNNGIELCLSNNACFSGKHYSQLPLFYAVDNTYKKANEVFVFNQENLIEPVTVYQLLKRQDTLFDVTDPGLAAKVGIESVGNVYNELFKKALSDTEVTDQALEILTRAKYRGYSEVLSTYSIINLTPDQIRCIFKYKEAKDAFVNEANARIEKTMRPVFRINEPKSVNLQDVLYDGFTVDDTPNAIKRYLNYCSAKCVCIEIEKNEYLPCYNGIVLSQANPLSSMASFCDSTDKENYFSVCIRLRELNKKINRYTTECFGTDQDYLRELRNYRQLFKASLGKKGYDNYIKLILRSGTDEKRFIQELIQNADDCQYEVGTIPTFSLYHKGNTIITEYNEKGFTRENIRAITAIGESTKNSLLNGETETIGKKGVGFKTIFAIASEVKIYSRDYRFCLTDREPTIPKLIGTKNDTVHGTRMEVTLKGRDVFTVTDSKDLLKLCLCLRKLKKLDIGGHTISIQDTEGSRIITIDNKTHVFKRYFRGFTVDERVAKEQDQKTDQKIICYIPEKKESIDYYIYNGLPTRHKLKIQMAIDAPFELTTSREEIEIDRAEWNDAIRTEMYRAILNVIYEQLDKERINIFDLYMNFDHQLAGSGPMRYVNYISDSAYINMFDNAAFLREKQILPSFQAGEYITPADKVALRFTDRNHVACYLFEHGDFGRLNPGYIIDETACPSERASKRINESLLALGCKEAAFSDVFQLIEEYAETYIENSEFRELLYPYLQQATGEYYDRIAKLAIIPVFGTRRGITEYHSYVDLDGELFVKKGASVSFDYYILNESILSKSVCEDILGVNINEMNEEYERAHYQKVLQQRIRNGDIESTYHYLLSEFRNGNIRKYQASGVLRANIEIVPLKNQLGIITDDELFICNQQEGYFPVKMIQNLSVAEECRKLAEEIKYRHLEEIHYEDIRYDDMLSDDDIECLMDSYFKYSDEIIRSFRKDGLIPDSVWRQYDLDYLTVGGISPVSQDYDFPEDPVIHLSQLQMAVKKQLSSPVEVFSKEVPRKVLFGKTTTGKEFGLESNDARQTALRKYNPDPGEEICFCQSCKTVKSYALIEVNNIEFHPKYYFPQLRIALCLECSKRFEMFRNNDREKRFLDRIKHANAMGKGTVEIPLFDDYSITFTAKHLAEIQEILSSELYS